MMAEVLVGRLILFTMCVLQITGDQSDETFLVELQPYKDVILPCIVKDTTSINIMNWSHIGKKGTLSDPNKYHLDEEKYTLTIYNSSWDDVGEYKCDVSPINGEKYTRHVSLRAQPFVRQLDKSKDVYHGDDLALDCLVLGYPKPHVEWKKGDNLVVQSEDGRINLQELKGIENATLKIANMQNEDQAQYSCFAVFPNSNDTIQSSIMVRVWGERVPTEPHLHKDVVLPCLVIDKATTNIMNWSHIGKNGTLFYAPKYKLDDQKFTLTIHHFGWDDVGEYECNVTPEKGENYTRQYSLQAPPTFVKKLEKSNNLYHGDTLIVDCWVQGYPKPYVEWRKGDIQMVESDDERIKFYEFKGIENATLKTENVQYKDRANYSCFAIVPNSNLTAQSSIMVRVKDKKEALWPLLGIIIMLIILAIILMLDNRRKYKLEAEDMDQEEEFSQSGHAENKNVRLRRK